MLLERSMTEDTLLGLVLSTARTFGWLAHHSRPAMMRSGRWATALQGDSGLPDLVMARAGHLVVAELKRYGRRPTMGQCIWLAEMAGVEEWPATRSGSHTVGNVTVALWTPQHWYSGEIEGVLRGDAQPLQMRA